MLGRDGGVLVGFEGRQPLDERRDVHECAELQPQPRARLVDEVDRLVGQHPLGQVAVAELDRGAERGIRVFQSVVLLVGGLEPVQDQDGILDRGLAHLDRLEAALERRVLLDRAVLLERRRTHQVQIAAREAGLQDVPGIHRALTASAGAHHRVHLVDEEDHAALERGDLVDRLGEALFEVAAIPGAGEHRGEVERHDALAEQLLGDGAGGDRLGESLDDRGLADARLADQHRVVLGAAAQDLDRLLDLVGAADDGVEASVRRKSGEVGAELVEHRGLGLGLPAVGGRCGAGRHRLAHGSGEGLRRHAGVGEDLPRRGVLRQHDREEQVLGVDVGRTRRAGDLEGVEERTGDGCRHHSAFGLGRGRRGRKPLLRGLGDRAGVGPDAAHSLAHRFLLDQHVQQMQGIQLVLTASEGEASGALQHVLRARAQEPGEVDRPLRASALTGEVPRDELVERAGGVSVTGERGEVFGHSRGLRDSRSVSRQS